MIVENVLLFHIPPTVKELNCLTLQWNNVKNSRITLLLIYLFLVKLAQMFILRAQENITFTYWVFELIFYANALFYINFFFLALSNGGILRVVIKSLERMVCSTPLGSAAMRLWPYSIQICAGNFFNIFTFLLYFHTYIFIFFTYNFLSIKN